MNHCATLSSLPQTVADLLRFGSNLLESRVEANLLLAHILQQHQTWLYAHGKEPLSPEMRTAFADLLQRRADGEPMAYLLGYREFYGREFRVDDRVLIPRPETEGLIDWALELPLAGDARVLDLGTGSGCIALTLAAERPRWQVSATDISGQALEVAQDNRRRLEIENVELLTGDLFQPVKSRRFDLIVSNPPYVAAGDPHLDRGDLRFEPVNALSAGADGLEIIKRIARKAPRQLKPDGWLLIEHGHDQSGPVRQLFDQFGLTGATTRPDLAGIGRVTGAQSP